VAARCEAAAKHQGAASDAYAGAEFAVPHDKAEEAEALRLQGIALDELRDIAVPMLWLRATTVDGLFAKAKAMKFSIPAMTTRSEIRLKKASRMRICSIRNRQSWPSCAICSRWPVRRRQPREVRGVGAAITRSRGGPKPPLFR
jgi:hypothetical protein